MRLILTILLIGLFKADAQIVINASSPYVPFGGGLLLDQYSGSVAAYSLRKIRSGYSGAAIRVRKDTTGQPEQDINFVGNELDTASLKSFLNARSGFVVTWYSQITGEDVTQSTQANQPRIALNGVIDRVNGKVCIVFDGSNDILTNTTTASKFSGANKSMTWFTALKYNAITTDRSAFGFGSSTSNNPIWRIQQGAANAAYWVRNDNATITTLRNYNANSTNQRLYSAFYDGSAVSLLENGSIVINALATTQGTVTIDRFAIGGILRPAAGLWGSVSMQELIFYDSNQLTNRLAVETNINTYYSIY